MATEFKHLEYLPLDEENLIVNDDPESNLKAKACLNLGFIAANSIDRFSNIGNINKNSFSNSATYLNLSYNLENLLMTVLNLNTISNITNTSITSHYQKRQTNISSNKILPNFSYCQNLTFTRFKTWGGFYGTLPYYINLLEEYNEYMTPSEITYYSTKSLFQYSTQVAYNKYLNNNDINYNFLADFYNQAGSLLDLEDEEADKKIYDISKNIILISPVIKDIFSEFNFYAEWIPKILEWKKGVNKELNIITNPSTNKERAVNTLLKCINIIYETGYEVELLKVLSSKFIKQTIDNSLINIINLLSIERSQCTYINLNEQNKSIEEELVIEFLTKVSRYRNSFDINTANNIIQECFCPPGGYSLLLLTLAANLINRAYIITTNNIKIREEIGVSDTYKRIIKLLGLASILLLKTDLPHIQITGSNILQTFELYLSDIDPNNLMDV